MLFTRKSYDQIEKEKLYISLFANKIKHLTA